MLSIFIGVCVLILLCGKMCRKNKQIIEVNIKRHERFSNNSCMWCRGSWTRWRIQNSYNFFFKVSRITRWFTQIDTRNGYYWYGLTKCTFTVFWFRVHQRMCLVIFQIFPTCAPWHAHLMHEIWEARKRYQSIVIFTIRPKKKHRKLNFKIVIMLIHSEKQNRIQSLWLHYKRALIPFIRFRLWQLGEKIKINRRKFYTCLLCLSLSIVVVIIGCIPCRFDVFLLYYI